MPYSKKVENWQSALIAHGFSCGPDGADGKLGDNTKRAISECKAHQRALNDHGFYCGDVDGWPGELFDKAVKECREWQSWLNSKGFYVGDSDGYPGPRFESGLRAFQRTVHISADAIVGPDTRHERAVYGTKPPAPAPAPTPAPVPAGEIEIIDHHLTFRRALTHRSLPVAYIIYHHTAGASSQSIESIHAEHLANGWVGIGYNLIVTPDGVIHKGRGTENIGAQCDGKNSISVGIAAPGNYETIEQMPEAQLLGLIRAGRYVRSLYPGAQPKGHGELDATACPGKHYPLEKIKAAVVL